MGRPRHNPRREATVDRLLATAEEEFGRVGFEAARLEDMARRAGISRPSLLYHFKSKSSLYAEVVRSVFHRMGAALAEAITHDGDFASRVDATVSGFQRFIAENPAVPRIVLRELIGLHGPGRKLLLREGLPVLDATVALIRRAGGAQLRRGCSIREALLDIGSAVMVRASSGELRRPFYGPRDHTLTLGRLLFLEDGS